MVYQIYHDTYSGAVASIVSAVEDEGYTLDDQTDLENIGSQVWEVISVGPSKPKPGDTNRFNLKLYKNNKEVKEGLHVQIFNRGTERNSYELNMYIL